MLETGGVLRTWALESKPQSGEMVWASKLADHRIAYLEYEGPISGNRGDVQRVDEGEYRGIEDSAEQILVELKGKTLRGSATLRCVDEVAQRWTIAFSEP
jgi:hypothetical protein